jgi:hypothetical protein
MNRGISRRKSETDHNRPKRGGDRRNLHQLLKGATITETTSKEESLWQRSQMRKPSDDAGKITGKPVTSAIGVKDPHLQSKDEVPTRNFFAILRPAAFGMTMETTRGNFIKGQQQQAPFSQTGRPPPIILTSQVNLVQLQRQMKDLPKGNYVIHDTKNGTRVVTKEITHFSTICSHFESNNLPYFTFHPKS